jgi:hypothetical protein
MLPVVLMAMFMAGFDIWAVNVAAPSLVRDLRVSDASLARPDHPLPQGRQTSTGITSADKRFLRPNDAELVPFGRQRAGVERMRAVHSCVSSM